MSFQFTNSTGWNAPRRSLLLVHPEGAGSKVSNEEINISFAPTPDYAGIAWAASGRTAWQGIATDARDLALLLPAAVKAVAEEGRSAALDAHLGGSVGKFVANGVDNTGDMI